MQQNSKFPLIFNKISGLTTVAQPEGKSALGSIPKLPGGTNFLYLTN